MRMQAWTATVCAAVLAIGGLSGCTADAKPWEGTSTAPFLQEVTRTGEVSRDLQLRQTPCEKSADSLL